MGERRLESGQSGELLHCTQYQSLQLCTSSSMSVWVGEKNIVLFHPRFLAWPCRLSAPFKCYEEAIEVNTVSSQQGDEMVDLVTDLINERWSNIPVERWRKLQ